VENNMSKVILFSVKKGGVGKTELATNQAVLLSQKRKNFNY